ncbi:LLM class flavin-dependent oxidoreductase [Amycolatopsis benzoatilytica]|uniref:LLM class flavin-dependent oxidoreductase n=1 Tax=Amycolatopsis benzoatilytica TaxID=346045 RepID=UPI00037F1126|nr:LLM class flavin-dependent oxidoreductase [Amycolatopsis benzoatilytica]
MTRRGVVLRLRGAPAAGLRRTCQVLDEAGCDTLYFEEDFVSCAAAAVVTRRVRICCLTTSKDAPAVADAAETLDYLSDGRFILGVGPLLADDGPYSGAAAAERMLEEVLERVPKLPVLVAGSGRGPARLAAEFAHRRHPERDEVMTPLTKCLQSVDEASAWLAGVTR